MAKITDLVKTYRMLSDPNAPDWNVKFVGGIAIVAIVVAAGAGALLWSMGHSDAPGERTAANVQEEPEAPVEDPCALPEGTPPPTPLPAACADAVLP